MLNISFKMFANYLIFVTIICVFESVLMKIHKCGVNEPNEPNEHGHENDPKFNLNDKIKEFDKVKNALDFTGKVALVTGSNSGIGAETVRLLSYLGAQVVVTGRNRTRVEEVANQCKQLAPHHYKVNINV